MFRGHGFVWSCCHQLEVDSSFAESGFFEKFLQVITSCLSNPPFSYILDLSDSSRARNMESGKRLLNYLDSLKREYILATTIFVMEPFEARIFHFLLLLVIIMCTYSTYVFLPAQILSIASWFGQLVFYPSRQGDSVLYADPHFKPLQDAA